MTCSPGVLSKLAVKDGTGTITWTSGAERYDFLYSTLTKTQQMLQQRGMSGTRTNMVERTKPSPYSIGGNISMDMSPVVLKNWLPRILGAAAAGTSFATAETIPVFNVLLDAVGGVFEFNGCYVNRGIFRAKADPTSTANIVEMIVDIFGKTQTLGTSFPSDIQAPLLVGGNSIPYIFYEGVLTVTTPSTSPVAYPIHSFVLGVDNALERRWVNSISATEICPQDRNVILKVVVPFTTTEYTAFYNTTLGQVGAAATLVFTNGTLSTTFTFTGLTWIGSSPEITGKQEIKMDIDFLVLGKGGAADIAVTNDSTFES